MVARVPRRYARAPTPSRVRAPLPPASGSATIEGMKTVHEAAGGDAGLLALARAWHERCLADPVMSHPFDRAGSAAPGARSSNRNVAGSDHAPFPA